MCEEAKYLSRVFVLVPAISSAVPRGLWWMAPALL